MIQEQEKIKKFLHDISNKIVPIKLKLEIMQEEHESKDLQFLESQIDEISNFIKQFQIEMKTPNSIIAQETTSNYRKATNKKMEIINSDQPSVLLVDDNQEILLSMSNALKRNGYSVSTCDNGKTALEIISKHTDKFHIIITDELMPGISGSDLIQHCRNINHDLKFICWSGYFEKDPIDTEKIKYLQKPISKDKLIKTIQELTEKNE